jgi:hypothetical protein
VSIQNRKNTDTIYFYTSLTLPRQTPATSFLCLAQLAESLKHGAVAKRLSREVEKVSAVSGLDKDARLKVWQRGVS